MSFDRRETVRRLHALSYRRSTALFAATLIGAFLLVSERAGAQTVFHVDRFHPACTDSGPGTASVPYRTIGAALLQHAGPGVTVRVHAGVYPEQVTVPASGAAGAPVVIEAEGVVTIDGADDFSSASRWVNHAGNVWRAVDVTWPPNQVFADGQRLAASGVAPDSLGTGTFRHVAGAGLYVNLGGPNPGTRALFVGRRDFGFRLSATSWVHIQGFAVTRTEDRGVYASSGSNDVTLAANDVSLAYRAGIQVSSSTGARLTGNRSHGHLDHGIVLSGATGALLEGNESWANTKPDAQAASGIYLSGSSGNTLRNNRSHHNEASGFYLQNASHGNRSIQNVAWANGHHGFDLYASTATRHLGDLAWGNGREGFTLRSGSTGTAIHDAIAAENGNANNGYQLYVESASAGGFDSNDNLIWTSSGRPPVRFASVAFTTVAAFTAATGYDTRSFEENPRFVDPAAGDFHLSTGSRAIDSGNAGLADWPAADHEGRARIDDPDVGNTGLGPIAYADRGPFEYAPVNHPPQGIIDEPGADVTVLAGQVVILAATGTDPDGHLPLAFAWNFGGGAMNTTLEDPGAVTFATPGRYTITLGVTDARGLADPTPATRVVTVLEPPPPSADARQVHWTITGPNSVTLSWAGQSDLVRYGVTTAYGQVARGVAPVPYPVSSPGPFWEARIVDLEPHTTYHYSIGGGPDHTFATARRAGLADFVACAEADIGDATYYPRVAPVQALIADIAPDLCLLPGDLTYGNDHGQAAVDRHFDDMMPWSTNAPYMPTWGNHEWEGDDLSNYKGRFDLPNAFASPGAPDPYGEDWYWFDYGNVRFIVYPERYTGAWSDWRPRADALMDQAQADPRIRFIVTMGHRPAYSSGHHSGSGTLASYLGTLGAEHSKYVLNVNGHSHNYERSYPQSGVVHITAGMGGATLEADQDSSGCLWAGGCPPPSWSAFRAMRHGVVRFHFLENGIRGEFVCGPAGDARNPNDVTCTPGDVVDSFLIGSADRSPVIGGPAVAQVARGATLTVPISAVDPDGQPITALTADLSDLPPGADAHFVASANNASGTLVWNTTAADGPRTWFVRLRASNGATGAKTLPIRVTGPDAAPIVTAPDTVWVVEGDAVTIPVTARDPDPDQDLETLFADLSGLPTGHAATFVAEATADSGTLRWTPGSSHGGQDYAVVFAAGNVLYGSATTVVRVTERPPGANHRPTAVLQLLPSAGATPLVVTADASASIDLDGEALLYRFDFGDGTIVDSQAAPSASHVYRAIGLWRVRVRIVDPRGGMDSTEANLGVYPNLAANPSFEDSISGWNAYGGSTIARLTGGGFEGDALLRVTGPATPATFGVNDSPNWIANTPGSGSHYRFSAWVRAAGTPARARIRVREYSGGAQVGATTSSTELTLTPAWQALSVDHVTSAGGSTLDLQIIDAATAGGEAFEVDNVAIRLLDTEGSPTAAPLDSLLGRPTAMSAAMVPNPARARATLRFAVTRGGPVSIGLYDVLGRRVKAVLEMRDLAPGEYQARVDGRKDDGSPLQAGVYFYRVVASEGDVIGRFVFMP